MMILSQGPFGMERRFKRVTASLMAVLAVMTLASAGAEGVTLWTVSSFAGADTAAEAYMEILRGWEEETGNTVIDDSETIDEAWKTGVLSDFAAGNEPDILFYFATGSDSAPILSRVVPIREINAAYPALQILEDQRLTEADGLIYAVPVRPFYEGLFVNADLFEQYDVPLPHTWTQLEEAIAAFNAQGIIPISVSLSDIPHYLAEFAILAYASPEEYAASPVGIDQVPDSWLAGMALLRRLWELGAFAPDAAYTTESAASQLFREKKAAMQIDGSWFAGTLSAEAMDTTAVLPVPAYAEGAGGAVIGGTSMGFYLTRCAWDSPRRDAAVALFAHLTGSESRAVLGRGQAGGKLGDSAAALLAGAGQLSSPIQDAMSMAARETWLLDCIVPVAMGAMTPEECWERVMALGPFQ